MFGSILIALSNGLLIGTSRTVNGHLGRKEGPIRAALWNHGVGFGFLSLPILFIHGVGPGAGAGAPVFAWLGGVLGVGFVAINSHVVVRLGASRTASLVVGAQILTGVAISNVGAPIDRATLVRLAGSALIILGIWVANSRRKPDRP
jgi:transporter family-2 protein